MPETEKLPEGTQITSDINGGLTGRIVGIASNEMPVVGLTYIIEITERIGVSWTLYPYSCIALPRTLFETVK
jgi:hypothetical protein